MLDNKKIVVIMPAYNAGKTLEKTYKEIPKDIVDEIIVVDDFSSDQTKEIAKKLKLKLFGHDKNKGYGANQKTCYKEAIKEGADIIIMLHPDYQYPPKLIPAMAGMLTSREFDIVIGSRVLCGMALKKGMPLYKLLGNKFLTFVQNKVTTSRLSEYHTGYRGYTKEVLTTLPLLENSDGFLFDNELLTQALFFRYKIGEISTPCTYHSDSSSIDFKTSLIYGLGVLKTTSKYFLQKSRLSKFKMFDKEGKKIKW